MPVFLHAELLRGSSRSQADRSSARQARLPQKSVNFYTFFAAALFAITGSASASAQSAADKTAAAAAEQQFAQTLAHDHGLNTKDILDTLGKARYQQSVIDAIARPAEAKPWKDYRPIFVSERRIDDGAAFYRANATLLKRTETDFGVPAELIVTILGVETNYGRVTGRYRVLDALTTLAFYYPPRQEFFRGELAQLFLLRSPSFPYAMDELTGSYAGAMGWGQFMPSSIARFARDGDGDGKVDLWNSLPDICASVANYFVAHGWQKGGIVAMRAHVSTDARVVAPTSLEPVYPLQQLADWGYTADSPPDSGRPGASKTDLVRTDPMMPATLITLDGAAGPETWITFENFYAISRYNKSPLYSLAVYQLSQEIAAQAADSAAP